MLRGRCRRCDGAARSVLAAVRAGKGSRTILSLTEQQHTWRAKETEAFPRLFISYVITAFPFLYHIMRAGRFNEEIAAKKLDDVTVPLTIQAWRVSFSNSSSNSRSQGRRVEAQRSHHREALQSRDRRLARWCVFYFRGHS